MPIDYISILYLALPAFVANAAPVIVARLKLFGSIALPIDGNRTWRGKPILGKHKTWRGLVAAMLGSVLVTLTQYILDPSLFISVAVSDSFLYALGYGALVGFLCMLGDMIGSLIKRRLGIASGKPFIPVDQTDYMIAYLFGTWFIFMWGWPEIIFLVSFALFANLTTNIIAYKLGIKSTYW